MKAEHLQACQVETPHPIVELAWGMARRLRNGQVFDSVVDLGAGDARFSQPNEAYRRYVGVEVDGTKVRSKALPDNAQIVHADAMKWEPMGFDLCIGNPPYIRHHRLDSQWRDEVLANIRSVSGIRLKKTANLFVLFLAQALIKTKPDGLVVQVIPFEWVSRPSASELRAHITEQGWDVEVFRFSEDIFPTVLTTASITIIDKSRKSGNWKFWKIGADGQSKPVKQPSGTNTRVLSYENRAHAAHAMRGLSPGGQEIFVLTEEERLHFGLKKKRDVVPCVTSLRVLPIELQDLDDEAFKKYYVDAGQRCWLIRSDKENVSPELRAYLDNVGDAWKKYSTCTLRQTWYQYKPHPVPQLLASSGFVGKRPKIALNSVKAVAVGAVYALFCTDLQEAAVLAQRLATFDFSKRVVSHSNNLKKVEVRQFNSVLTQLSKEGSR
ncbi:Eco57I restriction-modification methylase domain-containing protein [Noviherbaspirillum sp. ST9]|uniref:Eco57I restriction-modification methylase domain-containing protein n=1 Tax=Noviherbaspirillum sp. ST9 TaxID=3401606 RepID=UPI003B58A918